MKYLLQYKVNINPMSKLNFLVDFNPIALCIQTIFSKSELLQKLSNYFSNLLCNNTKQSAKNLLFALGVIAITYKTLYYLHAYYNMWKWIPVHIRNQKRVTPSKLKQRYGDCYAVVTGCTEGIGLSFALELAKMDFGIVFVARNKDKLKKRIQEIKAICPRLRYQQILVDLGKGEDLQRIGRQLTELCNKIDIGIIINNAGSVGSKFQKFINEDPKVLQNILIVNFTAGYKINSIMLPILRLRKNNRSAILNVSSNFAHYISHGTGTYTSSKIMQDIYSRTLSIQNRDKIDVMSVRPFGVRTAMMSMIKGKFMISPKTCVISTLADLGTADDTWTGFMHKVQASFMGIMTEQEVFQVIDKALSKFK